jgi:hypothetical protein
MSSQQQPPFDYQKWVHELSRQDAQRAHDKLDEFHRYVNEAAINAANLALRMALLINGGAAIALLSFDGDLADPQKKAVAATLVWFAWGVLTSVAGIALAYFTNYCMAGVAYSMKKNGNPPYVEDGPTTPHWKLANRIFHIAAVLVGVASLVLFLIGMMSVRAALLAG